MIQGGEKGEGGADIHEEESTVRREQVKATTQNKSSLSLESIRTISSIKDHNKTGRKHWDLYRHLCSPFVIYDALRLVLKNAGTGGLDNVQVQDIRGHEWEYTEQIVEDLRSRHYKPDAVRRVYIPKADGSERPLGIPNIIDRVVQRALVLLLEPIYEDIFHDFSHGFRPGKRAVDAAAIVAKECYERRYVLDADIEKFFDNVHHSKLIGMMKQKIADPRILQLIRQFLKSGFAELNGEWQATEIGTPQGGPLSPLLANIYLHYG